MPNYPRNCYSVTIILNVKTVIYVIDHLGSFSLISSDGSSDIHIQWVGILGNDIHILAAILSQHRSPNSRRVKKEINHMTLGEQQSIIRLSVQSPLAICSLMAISKKLL